MMKKMKFSLIYKQAKENSGCDEELFNEFVKGCLNVYGEYEGLETGWSEEVVGIPIEDVCYDAYVEFECAQAY